VYIRKYNILNILKIHQNIRTRLIFLFVLQVIIILVLIGFYLNWQIRTTLEQELAKTLQAIAASTAVQIEPDFLLTLNPGDEANRTYRNIQRKLLDIRDVTGMKRIYIFRADKTSLADTQPNVPVGVEYLHLQFNVKEMTHVFSGKPASSILFEGEDDRYYKSGFAPISVNGVVVAAVGVDGSAQTLDSVRQIQRNLLTLGSLGILISIFLAIIFANRITIPLKKLEKSAREIGRGDLQRQIEFKGHDEVAFLGRTLEEMRRGIIQRDKRQMMMLAGVAHEIRNPLGGIELFAGLLSDELSEGEQKSAAQKILKEVRNLKKITQEFLDWAKPSSVRKEHCRVRTIFKEAYSLLGEGATAADIRYSETPKDISLFVDPQNLKRIFLNIIQNSIQATPSSSCQIQISVEKLDSKHFTVIKFADNGPGIPEENQAKIFEPFFTTRKHGTGLGLAVVKNLVEENGGHIELAGSSPAGSVFAIYFPNPLSRRSKYKNEGLVE